LVDDALETFANVNPAQDSLFGVIRFGYRFWMINFVLLCANYVIENYGYKVSAKIRRNNDIY